MGEQWADSQTTSAPLLARLAWKPRDSFRECRESSSQVCGRFPWYRLTTTSMLTKQRGAAQWHIVLHWVVDKKSPASGSSCGGCAFQPVSCKEMKGKRKCKIGLNIFHPDCDFTSAAARALTEWGGQDHACNWTDFGTVTQKPQGWKAPLRKMQSGWGKPKGERHKS